MMEELDRIFCKKLSKKLFFGISVHYKLSVKEDIIADEMIDFLVNCLYLNPQFTFVFPMPRIDGPLCPPIRKSLAGQLSDLLAEYIKEFSGNILFFFVENSSHPGFVKQLLRKFDEELDIIEIQEGVGNVKQASAYFLDLLVDSNMHRFFENEVVFEPGKFYSTTEVRTKFNQWRKARLKDRGYSAYSYSQTLQIDKAIQKKGSAFDAMSLN